MSTNSVQLPGPIDVGQSEYMESLDMKHHPHSVYLFSENSVMLHFDAVFTYYSVEYMAHTGHSSAISVLPDGSDISAWLLWAAETTRRNVLYMNGCDLRMAKGSIVNTNEEEQRNIGRIFTLLEAKRSGVSSGVPALALEVHSVISSFMASPGSAQ